MYLYQAAATLDAAEFRSTQVRWFDSLIPPPKTPTHFQVVRCSAWTD